MSVNNSIANVIASLYKENVDKEFIENLDKNSLFTLCREFIDVDNKELTKLNINAINIFNKNLDTIYTIVNKYAIEEEEKRTSILNKRCNYNKVLYEPFIEKKMELEKIRRQIDLLEIELDNEKITNAFASVFNDIDIPSKLLPTIKELNIKYNIEKKNFEKLEQIYNNNKENTCIPYGKFAICIDSLKTTSKFINICKKNMLKNEYINSFENKIMIPYDFAKHNLSNVKKEDLLQYVRFRKVETEDTCNDFPTPIIDSEDKLKLTVIYDIITRIELIEHLLEIKKITIDNESLKDEILSLRRYCFEQHVTRRGDYLLNKFNYTTFEVVIVSYTKNRTSYDISTYIIDFDKTILNLVL
jgi:hypothetical protein